MHCSDCQIARRRFAALDGILVGFALVAALSYSDELVPAFNLAAFLATRLTVQNVLRAAAVFAIWAVLMRLFRTYASGPMGAWPESFRIAAALVVTALLLSLTFDGRHQGASAPHIAIEFAVFSFLSLCGIRALAALLANFTGAVPPGRYRAVVIGTGPRAMRTFRLLRTKLHRSHTLLGFFDTSEKSVCPGEIESMFIGSLASLESYLVDHVVDEVFVALPARSCYAAIEQTAEICTRAGIRIQYPDDTFPSALAASHYERLIVKRLFDMVFALIAIIAASPLLLVITALVKFSSPGPVFFFQERYGLGRRRFKICKFRSMADGADPRVTKAGAFLRRTSLDELPQLFNVLAGHMSLVGPRPMSVRDVSQFNETWPMRRFSVKPGITGLWQVTGRSNTSLRRWIELDLQYVDNWSLGLDAKILALTVPAVLKGTGAM